MLNQIQNQPQNPQANQQENLRKPPTAGGPRRVPEIPLPKIPSKKPSKFKKALPYLIAGGSTGIGMALGLTDFFTP